MSWWWCKIRIHIIIVWIVWIINFIIFYSLVYFSLEIQAWKNQWIFYSLYQIHNPSVTQQYLMDFFSQKLSSCGFSKFAIWRWTSRVSASAVLIFNYFNWNFDLSLSQPTQKLPTQTTLNSTNRKETLSLSETTGIYSLFAGMPPLGKHF